MLASPYAYALTALPSSGLDDAAAGSESADHHPFFKGAVMTVQFHRPTLFAASLAATTCLATAPVLADLAPEDVWTDWQRRLAEFGYTPQAQTTTDGQTLVLNNFRVSIPAENGSTLRVDMGAVRLVPENADNVRIEYEERFDLRVFPDGDDAPSATLMFDVAQSDPRYVATGEPDAISYSYTAGDLMISLSGIDMDGADVAMNASGSLAFDGADITYGTNPADGGSEIVQSVNFNAVRFALDLRDDDEDTDISISLAMQDFGNDATMRVPDGFDMSDTDMLTTADWGYDAQGKLGALRLGMSGRADGSEFEFNLRTGPNTIAASLSGDALSYDVNQEDVVVSSIGSQIPVPIDGEIDTVSLRVKLPLRDSEEPQDFTLALNLLGLTLSDAIWGLVDAGGLLPRSPADLIIDLDGSAIVMSNLLDEAAVQALALAGAPPMLPQTINLNQLRLAVAGAVLEGTGAFAFTGEPSPLSAGFPSPVGSVDLDLKGANALLDSLISLGLMADQEAMGLRMMMGLLAESVGEDHLQSKIEMTSQGHIIANGQRIQ